MSIAMESARAFEDAMAANRRKRLIAVAALAAGAVVIAIASLGAGAVEISPARVVAILAGAGEVEGREALVIMNIRLPRLLLGLLVGAALGVSGAMMQGLFRNPLADPGLVGVSAGAGLAAAVTIVLGERYIAPYIGVSTFLLLPIGAFLGGLATTLALYGIATREGRTSVATMLLAGIALGALAGSFTGLLAYASDDRQLRDLTFWSLGSLGGATWAKLAVVAPIILPILFATPMLARGLNALVLGEAEAFHLGISVQRLKAMIILLVAAAVGASVAVAGVIGFVGIVVPHLLRLIVGPDHRLLLPLCAVLGGALLAGADILARTIVAPSELPIGIVTAAIGAPFFLWLLLHRNRSIAS
jgi:iron complex transport system permease protein